MDLEIPYGFTNRNICVCFNEESQWFGWVFVKNQDGNWVSAAKLTSFAIEMLSRSMKENFENCG